MGIVKGIAHDEWPKQSNYVGVPTDVTFHFDTSKILRGVIVRDDLTEPGETIIRLDDGRYVRSVECQYSPDYMPNGK